MSEQSNKVVICMGISDEGEPVIVCKLSLKKRDYEFYYTQSLVYFSFIRELIKAINEIKYVSEQLGIPITIDEDLQDYASQISSEALIETNKLLSSLMLE